MAYIESGKAQGATVHTGGVRSGDKGFFIEPTLFTETRPDMKIVQEEIFGPVGVIIKFKTEEGSSLECSPFVLWFKTILNSLEISVP